MHANHHQTETARLQLTAPTDSDLDELWALFSDPAVWEHLPTGRHHTREQTAGMIARQTASWRHHHLGAWVLRPHENPHGPLLGLAGCSHHNEPTWNLSYRLTRTAWGHGYAAEASAAALTAAADTDPRHPRHRLPARPQHRLQTHRRTRRTTPALARTRHRQPHRHPPHLRRSASDPRHPPRPHRHPLTVRMWMSFRSGRPELDPSGSSSSRPLRHRQPAA